MLRGLLAAWVLGAGTLSAAAQLQLAEIRGVVVDQTGAVLPAATVELTDPLGGVIASRRADDAGRFAFANISPGRYTLAAGLAGFETNRRDLTITHALPVHVTVRLAVGTVVEVTAEHATLPDSPATRASIAGESISHVPIRNTARGVQEVVATLPGWSTEDNGLLHARGTDDGFLYVIDGIPVYERLDQLSGIAPGTDSIESINVMTGFLPAEHGYKAGGVIEVRSKPVDAGWSGALAVDRGTDSASDVSASAGGSLSRLLTLSLTAAALQSDRFLDPVHPDNLHNRGKAGSAAATAAWTPAHSTVLTLSAGAGHSAYGVPNTESQHAAGQDQQQQILQWYGTANWQHAWSAAAYSQVSGYARRTAAGLDASDADTPLTATADRTLRRIGVLATTAWHAGTHLFKTGLDAQQLALEEAFSFAVTDSSGARDAGFSREARQFDRRQPFRFAGHAQPGLVAAFIQDDWTATRLLSISGGIRIDRTALLLPRVQVSPRAGLTYRAAGRTVLRASVSRFFQPPQPEHLLLSSSEEARVLSPFVNADIGGGAGIEPERQWAFEGGVDHDLSDRVRLDAALWFRSITDAADPNVFAGTTIVFPNAVASGRAYGLDARVEVRRQRAWSGYASVALGRIRQRGPITGGLFLEDEVGELADGEAFIPDHDQAMVASGGVTWVHLSSGASAAAVVRHESGTPIGEGNEDELSGRPGAGLVDFKRGRVAPRTVVSIQARIPLWKHRRVSGSAQLAVENLFDARYAYNFGNPFSGTHFGAPRSVSAGLRVRF